MIMDLLLINIKLLQPSPEYAPEDIVRYIVKGLQYNDLPEPNTGLRRLDYPSSSGTNTDAHDLWIQGLGFRVQRLGFMMKSVE
jgi:hypothetical protein